ncbi:helix-turn-helix domain-containing protein [Castellaniella sp.]|uniref:helix-turn-helix domain-containing protein n=1 Tax=Castellaniella sp. TaxID=1955812 RepID=UPI002AFF587F|nr:helix-turn-helix domain-containing protein [Castellaniella sp.]
MDALLLLTRLGTQIRQMRTRRGLTQAALAQRAGLTRQKLIEIEHGADSVGAGYYARAIAALGAELHIEPARMPTLEELKDIFP